MSEEVKHTPGPWHIGDGLDWSLVIRGPKDEYVAKLGENLGKKVKANGRLIAAAPDLLEAAKCLRQHLALFAQDSVANEIFERVDTIIFKATGTTP